MYDFVKDDLELFFEDEGAFDGALAVSARIPHGI